jgi:tRNA modification GTPase
VIFVDTAGLRGSEDPVEQEGVARARARAEAADLVLWLVPPDEPEGPAPAGQNLIRVATKADLGQGQGAYDVAVSARTGAGMAELLDRVAGEAVRFGGPDALITRERHRSALSRAEECLGRALHLFEKQATVELAAEELRLAARAVGQVTGRVDVDDVLDRLFSSFCIGK